MASDTRVLKSQVINLEVGNRAGRIRDGLFRSVGQWLGYAHARAT